MVLKFCFANEIHRCSEFPTQYDELQNFLTTTFKASLPQKYQLRYIYPGTESERLIATQQDFDELLNFDSSKPIKVTIHEVISLEDHGKVEMSDYDIIGKQKEAEPVEEKAPGLEKIVEQMSESVIVPQVNKMSYFNIVPSAQDENVRQVVKDVLKEQMPFIISQVKDAILKELRAEQPIIHVAPQPQVILREEPIKVAQYEEKKVNEKVQEEPEDFYKPEYIKPVEAGHDEDKGGFNVEEVHQDEINEIQEEKGNAFFNKIKNIGRVVAELPGKAKVALEDWSNKIEGDPHVIIEEGRYPQTVVDKATSLREVFVDESLKTLLDFVSRYPRNANLEQLAHAFLFKDQPQDNQEPVAEQLDNQPAPVDGNQMFGGH